MFPENPHFMTINLPNLFIIIFPYSNLSWMTFVCQDAFTFLCESVVALIYLSDHFIKVLQNVQNSHSSVLFSFIGHPTVCPAVSLHLWPWAPGWWTGKESRSIAGTSLQTTATSTVSIRNTHKHTGESYNELNMNNMLSDNCKSRR